MLSETLLQVLIHPDGSTHVLWAEIPKPGQAQPHTLDQGTPSHMRAQLGVRGGTSGQKCPHMLLRLRKRMFALARPGEL